MTNEDGFESEEGGTSTIPPVPDRRWVKREKRINLVGTFFVVLVVALGALGLTGVRTTTAAVESSGVSLEVRHASITRPGLATPFSVTVRSEVGELPRSLTLGITSAYLAAFDEHGLTPTPTRTHSDAEWTWWTFELPADGDELTVELDARLEPSVHWRRHGTVAVMADGDPQGELSITTWILP